MTRKKTPSAESPAGKNRSAHSGGNPFVEKIASKSVRETVESIVIAFILAFLFRTFEAEAFVIPTGSMATTLMGRHKDFECPQCDYSYQSGASLESELRDGKVTDTTCPMCRFVTDVSFDPGKYPSFTGDRILVNKFIYDFEKPERYDVIVFKYPGNAKQNYIKRLIGKPGETVRIHNGNIFVRPESEESFEISRKAPDKIKAMMQIVYDTRHVARSLRDANFPRRWQTSSTGKSSWTILEQDSGNAVQRSFKNDGSQKDTLEWLRYHHILPSQEDWLDIDDGSPLQGLNRRESQLITDFYSYNAYYQTGHSRRSPGYHWVGDLIMECEVTVESEQGLLFLDLVEAGRHYRCQIDVATGEAKLSIVSLDGQTLSFSADQRQPRAKTSVQGKGTYHLRFANVDDQLVLWVNDDHRLWPRGPVVFDSSTNYSPPKNEMPDWNSSNSGDLAPVGIGGQGATLSVAHLRILRDIYYIAVKHDGHSPSLADYDRFSFRNGQAGYEKTEVFDPFEIEDILTFPRIWRDQQPADAEAPEMFRRLFESRRHVEFELLKDPENPERDQFLPMGDNSPQSSDARIWGREHYVERKFLTGKAVFIYWPHTKRKPLPITPNFERMKFVK